jgi:formate hydrogenlyase transcriptional activator
MATNAVNVIPLDPYGAKSELIGSSQGLRNVCDSVQMVARTDSAVLIQGETGTGKELVAKAIHQESLRRRGPYVTLNCAALPAGLLESELFGHERGAFTGALAQRTGRFQLAHTGTLFLDEIGDLPLELQPKLLRVLQEQEFERLGSSRTIRVDVRIVAATNQDLAKMVRERRFRADLFYDDVIETLQQYDWPGNIRELQNVIERAVIMSLGHDLQVEPGELKRTVSSDVKPIHTLAEAERDHILKVLRQAGGVVGGRSGAAARLGLPRTTLIFRMRKLGIAQERAVAVGDATSEGDFGNRTQVTNVPHQNPFEAA